MKIWIDGEVREMTPQEEAEYIDAHAHAISPDDQPEEILNIILGGAT